MIIDNNFHELYLDYVRKIPNTSINIDFSNKCLLQCAYCMRQKPAAKDKIKRSSDMSFNDWKKILQLFPELVELCGQLSDPIYHPDFIKFLEYASQNNTYVHIHTTGTGKKRHFWNKVFSIKKRFRFVFGIDGLDQKTCNLHRIGQNFHQAFKAMLLGAQSHHRIVWQFIPFRHNEHQIERAKDIARKHNIQLMILKSNRWYPDTNVLINNKLIKRDWIHPPSNPDLYVEWGRGNENKKEYYM